MRRVVMTFALLAVFLAIPRAQTSATWPSRAASVVAGITLGTNGVPTVPFTSADATQDYWCDLTTVGSSCDLTLYITANSGPGAYVGTPDAEITYYVHGIPVSTVLASPYNFNLARSDADLSTLCNGIHDISILVEDGAVVDDHDDWRFYPMFLHYFVSGNVNGACTQVPLLTRDVEYEYYTNFGYSLTTMGSKVVYVATTATPTAYPIRTDIFTPWTGVPYEADLYQEQMMPHTDQFVSAQMWWATPAGNAQPNLKYARAFNPKHDEQHTGLRVNWQHGEFPIRDGGRGVGWTSPYWTGIVQESNNVMYFVENGQGTLRELLPNGELETIAGWMTDPAKLPIHIKESKATVRQNQILKGDWQGCLWGGSGDGFWTPMDVAQDPSNEEIFYVVEFEGNRICKVEEGAGAGGEALITLFAGSSTGASGYTNATGSAARFNKPTSIVFDPVCDCMYVADSDNDAIRKITRAGVVTTLVGMAPGGTKTYDILSGAGVSYPTYDEYTYQAAARASAAVDYEVTSGEAAGGDRPEIHYPFAIRVASDGDIIWNDVGFASVRRMDVTTFETFEISTMEVRWSQPGTYSTSGWSWLDVDRWGNSGPLDGVYFGAFQASHCTGDAASHANESYCWAPGDGSALGKFIFNDDDSYPDGWGKREKTDPPHYFWAMIVIPNGGVYLGGGGEHGITRLRIRKDDDLFLTNYNGTPNYYDAKFKWNFGGSVYTPSSLLKFGSECHNYLGFADCWSIADGATDGEIDTLFELPLADMTADDEADVRMFIRYNAGAPVDETPPDPAERRFRLPFRIRLLVEALFVGDWSSVVRAVATPQLKRTTAKTPLATAKRLPIRPRSLRRSP